MSDYAIGDVQGCYEPLQRLLEHLDFDEKKDTLWFVGDLVNRGPESLAVLRFVKSLPIPAQITLGNHDLHFLGSLFGGRPWTGHDDTIQELLDAPDAEELGHWLRKQPLIIYSHELNTVMCHAGIAPIWDLTQALDRGTELGDILSGDFYADFLKRMYGNKSAAWSENLSSMDRLKMITDYCTRMRFCTKEGQLDLSYKGNITKAPSYLCPWYAVPSRKAIEPDIVFGHWAALKGICPNPRIHAIDTGCIWGGTLTAIDLKSKERFSVPGLGHSLPSHPERSEGSP